ncbi:MAG: glycosyltransferase family 2 protein [Clostridia bacterium]|nr:glycosyltransferase family 2 protein [Clostridia bacterium]
MDISVVIPVYGCRAALPELHRRLTESLSKITNDYEIILVNDACPQNSWEDIEKICDKDSKVKGIELSRNFGQIYAITAGLDNSKGEWVVVMDCDLQDRPEEIINLYNKAQEGYDVVFARRAQRKDSALKIFVSKLFYSVCSFATDTKFDPAICNFSIISRKVVDSYCSMREVHRAYVAYIKWLGFKQTAIDVEHNDRAEGKSSYNFKKRMRMAMEIITSQSDKVLKFIVGLGFIVAMLSLLGAIAIIIKYFISNILSGWTSTIVALCFFGGLAIMSIGIVGIYVGNIFMQSKERPLYIIRTIKNDNQEVK